MSTAACNPLLNPVALRYEGPGGPNKGESDAEPVVSHDLLPLITSWLLSADNYVAPLQQQ